MIDQITSFIGFNFLIDIIIFTLIMLSPIPTAPLLIFFVINQGIYEASFLYLISTTINCIILYSTGLLVKKSPSFAKIILYWKNKIIENKFFKIFLKKFFPKINKFNFHSLIQKVTVYDIAAARFLGIHNHFICFGFGYLKISLINPLIVNTVFALIDLMFYWSVIGGGLEILKIIFPDINFVNIMQSSTFYYWCLIVMIFTYLVLIFYRFKKANNSK